MKNSIKVVLLVVFAAVLGSGITFVAIKRGQTPEATATPSAEVTPTGNLSTQQAGAESIAQEGETAFHEKKWDKAVEAYQRLKKEFGGVKLADDSMYDETYGIIADRFLAMIDCVRKREQTDMTKLGTSEVDAVNKMIAAIESKDEAAVAFHVACDVVLGDFESEWDRSTPDGMAKFLIERGAGDPFRYVKKVSYIEEPYHLIENSKGQLALRVGKVASGISDEPGHSLLVSAMIIGFRENPNEAQHQ